MLIHPARDRCTQHQIDTDDIISCDLLDEFNFVATTAQTHPNPGQRAPGDFMSYCTETAEPAGHIATTGPWDRNDCARTGFYMLNWTTHLSGLYDLRVYSFGVLIQTAVYVPGADEDVTSYPPHDFQTVMPVSVYINPGALMRCPQHRVE